MNLDIAAADVQNAVQSSLGQLPAEVQQLGITVVEELRRVRHGHRAHVGQQEFDTLDDEQLRATQYHQQSHARAGVSRSHLRPAPVRDAHLDESAEAGKEGLDATDVVSALQEQNVAVAAGSIGSPPAPANQPYTYTVNALTQLSIRRSLPTSFCGRIPTAGYVRLGDVARIELGAQSYTTDLRFDGQSQTVGLGVYSIRRQTPWTSPERVTAMNQLAPEFPPGSLELGFRRHVLR